MGVFQNGLKAAPIDRALYQGALGMNAIGKVRTASTEGGIESYT